MNIAVVKVAVTALSLVYSLALALLPNRVMLLNSSRPNSGSAMRQQQAKRFIIRAANLTLTR